MLYNVKGHIHQADCHQMNANVPAQKVDFKGTLIKHKGSFKGSNNGNRTEMAHRSCARAVLSLKLETPHSFQKWSQGDVDKNHMRSKQTVFRLNDQLFQGKIPFLFVSITSQVGVKYISAFLVAGPQSTILHVGKMYFHSVFHCVCAYQVITNHCTFGTRWQHRCLLKGHLLIWAPSEVKDWIIQVQLWFSSHPWGGEKYLNILMGFIGSEHSCFLPFATGKWGETRAAGENPSNHQRASC